MGALLTSTRVNFQWETADEAPSEVAVTRADGTTASFKGPAGRHHHVDAQGLQQDQEYSWEARSGDRVSTPRRFRLVRGIEFVERTYSFDIVRDYDQRGTIRVVNHSDAPGVSACTWPASRKACWWGSSARARRTR
jgi:hypothetical protein